MQCPECGENMNHHADKVVEPADDRERAMVDHALGGVVQEAHSCARCGTSGFRLRPAERPEHRQ